MKNIKVLIIKSVTLSFFVLFLLSTIIFAQEHKEIQLYNKNEKVQLSKSLIHKNDDYYISVDDLSKINIEYKYTENNDGFEFKLYSKDFWGIENILKISAISDELNILDLTTLDFVSVEAYDYTNTMESKKSIDVNSSGMQLLTRDIGDYTSVYKDGDDYYISLKVIGIAISYEYTVNENVINLWITDSNHQVVNGYISLPDGEVAPEGGMYVDIFVTDGDNDLTGEYTLKTVCIPLGKNKIYYFIETDIRDKYIWLMFEFEGNYKTVNEFVSVATRGKLDITTTSTEKKNFSARLTLPNGLEADNDIYAMIILERCSVYKSKEPIIRKGESSGRVTFNIDKDYVGKIALNDISGDERIFDYGYLGLGKLVLLEENARLMSTRYDSMSVNLLQCYEISGQVIPKDINSGYNVMVSGVSESNEEISLKDEIGDDYTFSIKVPVSLPEYTLSVAYKPGVYCGYISDGVSEYSGEYNNFENICDYHGIKLKYEPYLPDLPIEMIGNTRNGYVEVKNISDDIITDVTLYCAYYSEGKLIYVSSVFVDNIMVYSDYNGYDFEHPVEFYKVDEVKFFAWNNRLKPLSLSISKKVNEPDYSDDKEFSDVDASHRYYTAIKEMYKVGIVLEYMDGTIHPDEYIIRGEAATIFFRIMGYWNDNNYAYEFSCEDVSESYVLSSEIGICVNEKIFELQDNKFRPKENITVDEVYEAIQNILELKEIEINPSELLINIDIENLERDITRAEFAQMAYNYQNYIKK